MEIRNVSFGEFNLVPDNNIDRKFVDGYAAFHGNIDTKFLVKIRIDTEKDWQYMLSFTKIPK